MVQARSTLSPRRWQRRFGKLNPTVQFKIGFSGTNGGFKKLCAGQLDIAGASRPINASESEQCKAQHIEY